MNEENRTNKYSVDLEGKKIKIKGGCMAVHFFYVVLILASTIVLLMTFNWTQMVGFPEYLAVATGITSLVLGVLAIIYSFVSTGMMNYVLGSVGKSTDSMVEIADKINSSLAKGEDLQRKAEQKTDELHSMTLSLSSSIKKLEENTGGIISHVADMPQRIVSSMSAFDFLGQRNESIGQDLKKGPVDYEAFLSKSSSVGVAALKFVVGCYRKKCYFDCLNVFSDVGESDGVSAFSYAYGYLIAVDSCGYVVLKMKDGSNRSYYVDGIDGEFVDLVEREWGKRLSNDSDGAMDVYKKSMSVFFDGITDADLIKDVGVAKDVVDAQG